MNEVVVEGRVSGGPERRVLPSGDEVVMLRVVVPRDGGGVDTLPVSVGPAPGRGRRPREGQIGRRALTAAAAVAPDAVVRVEGTLRRRWWRADGGRRSIIEISAHRLVLLDQHRT